MLPPASFAQGALSVCEATAVWSSPFQQNSLVQFIMGSRELCQNVQTLLLCCVLCLMSRREKRAAVWTIICATEAQLGVLGPAAT